MSNLREVQVFFFRHGETDWNRERRWQGHVDTPLNDLGRTQALALIDPLKSLGIEAIFSSDLSRALETAQIANRDMKLPLAVSEGLRECNLGEAEGKLFTEVIEKWGEESLTRWNSFIGLEFGYPGGETKRQTQKRVLESVKSFLESNSYKRIAVSTHGMAIRTVLSAAGVVLAVPTPVPNCSLHAFVFRKSKDGIWTIRVTDAEAVAHSI